MLYCSVVRWDCKGAKGQPNSNRASEILANSKDKQKAVELVKSRDPNGREAEPK